MGYSHAQPRRAQQTSRQRQPTLTPAVPMSLHLHSSPPLPLCSPTSLRCDPSFRLQLLQNFCSEVCSRWTTKTTARGPQSRSPTSPHCHHSFTSITVQPNEANMGKWKGSAWMIRSCRTHLDLRCWNKRSFKGQRRIGKTWREQFPGSTRKKHSPRVGGQMPPARQIHLMCGRSPPFVGAVEVNGGEVADVNHGWKKSSKGLCFPFPYPWFFNFTLSSLLWNLRRRSLPPLRMLVPNPSSFCNFHPTTTFASSNFGYMRPPRFRLRMSLRFQVHPTPIWYCRRGLCVAHLTSQQQGLAILPTGSGLKFRAEGGGGVVFWFDHDHSFSVTDQSPPVLAESLQSPSLSHQHNAGVLMEMVKLLRLFCTKV